MELHVFIGILLHTCYPVWLIPEIRNMKNKILRYRTIDHDIPYSAIY